MQALRDRRPGALSALGASHSANVAGCRTEWVANAEEALERLGVDGNGFEVVFSDVLMPGMGGIALAKDLERRLPDLPVILASGYSHALAQDGAQGFELLHKPYLAEQLARVLRERRRTAGPGTVVVADADLISVSTTEIPTGEGRDRVPAEAASGMPDPENDWSPPAPMSG
ncbi:response regulator [Methylobacterium sp. C25]|nr:response regulator [Methylobacterium sp. C25]